MRQLIRIFVVCAMAFVMARDADAKNRFLHVTAHSEGCGSDRQSDLRVAVLGDSMTWIGGDSCQNDCGWTHFFKQEVNPNRIDIYARSGATWTNTCTTYGNISLYSEILDDENVLYSQALRLIKAAKADSSCSPNLIILYAGANDAWFAETRPGIFDTLPAGVRSGAVPSECTSLQASIRLVCNLLRKVFPQARMVLISPTEMTRTSVERIRRVGDIIQSTGQEFGLTVLRPDLDVEIRSKQESITFTNTTDGVHSNSLGAELIARYVVSKL